MHVGISSTGVWSVPLPDRESEKELLSLLAHAAAAARRPTGRVCSLTTPLLYRAHSHHIQLHAGRCCARPNIDSNQSLIIAVHCELMQRSHKQRTQPEVVRLMTQGKCEMKWAGEIRAGGATPRGGPRRPGARTRRF